MRTPHELPDAGAADAAEVERLREELAEALLDAHRYRQLHDELVELLPDAYLVTDPNGKVLEANGHAGHLFGVDARSLMDKPLAVHIAPPLRREFRQWLLELEHLTETDRRVVRFQRRSGVPFDAAVTVQPTAREQDGQVVELRWLVRDVTTEQQAEGQLWELNATLEAIVEERTRELEAQSVLLAAVLDQLPVGVALARAPGGELIGMSRYAQAMLGSPGTGDTVSSFAQSPVRRPDGTPVPPQELPLARSLRGERVEGELLVVETAEGARTIVARAEPVQDAAGDNVAAVIVFEDVTEREAREGAERAFVANAAHELRTPLAAIVSAIEVLQAGAKDDPDERERFLAHLERESGRLGRLARALLVLARAQSRAEPPRVEVVALEPLLRALQASLRPARGVRVEAACAEGAAVLANRDLLEQALEALAANAIRYTTEGEVVLAARMDDREAVIEIRDTGPGIPEAARQRVFERFYRASQSADGFGLGLAIARDAAEALSGTLELESEENVGTTARLRLPPATLLPGQ